MEEIAWKCSAAFLLGAATHYFISSQLQSPDTSTARQSPAAVESKEAKEEPKEAEEGQDDEYSSSDDSEWEGADEESWQPHKMILCVRTDLKMGKGALIVRSWNANG